MKSDDMIVYVVVENIEKQISFASLRKTEAQKHLDVKSNHLETLAVDMNEAQRTALVKLTPLDRLVLMVKGFEIGGPTRG